jgi:23S rRNA (pseudouridine1915-N3)-methyltransferase
MPLKLTVISPGKTRERWLQDALDDYTRRLRRYCRVQWINTPDTWDSGDVDHVLAQEGEKILRRIKPSDFVVALDLKGQQPDSPALSGLLFSWLEKGGSEVVFVIGGAHGLHSSVLERSNDQVSLSRLTWTHQMTRLLLIEQCYRAFRIRNHEPYHK